MIYNQILVRFGDLTLKGKNQKEFLNREYALVRRKLEGLHVNIINRHDRIYIDLLDEDYKKVINALDHVSGLYSYSLCLHSESTIEDIKKNSLLLLQNEIKKPATFKLEVRRANKKFPLNSMEMTQELSSYILKEMKILHVDVHNPEKVLTCEIREDGTYLYLNAIRGIGGFPVGVAGKGMLMLSGGLDSPVAGYLAQKQGIEIECLHFESTPLTSIESSQKVVDLVKSISAYSKENKMALHMVPFKELHMAILDHIPDSYIITIMRRMMYRIATKLALKRNCLCIVNGESVGQVASQTLQSMYTINNVTNFPIIRPLAVYDKVDIVSIAHKIGTYEMSIRPFEDCCTVYLPKNPATAPKLDRAIEYEKTIDYEALVDWCVENTKTIYITPDSDLDLSLLGLEVRQALENLKK